MKKKKMILWSLLLLWGLFFVAGTDKEFINQICDYNENAEHDDAPDSVASQIRRLWNKKDTVSTYQSILR